MSLRDLAHRTIRYTLQEPLTDKIRMVERCAEAQVNIPTGSPSTPVDWDAISAFVGTEMASRWRNPIA